MQIKNLIFEKDRNGYKNVIYLPLFDESFSQVTSCHTTVRHNTKQLGKYKHVEIRLESTLKQPWDTNKSMTKNGKKSYLMPSTSMRIETVLSGYH